MQIKAASRSRPRQIGGRHLLALKLIQELETQGLEATQWMQNLETMLALETMQEMQGSGKRNARRKVQVSGEISNGLYVRLSFAAFVVFHIAEVDRND